MQVIPKDPIILLSFINTKLRDFYPNLELLCEDFQVDTSDIIARLEAIGYKYNTDVNSFQ